MTLLPQNRYYLNQLWIWTSTSLSPWTPPLLTVSWLLSTFPFSTTSDTFSPQRFKESIFLQKTPSQCMKVWVSPYATWARHGQHHVLPNCGREHASLSSELASIVRAKVWWDQRLPKQNACVVSEESVMGQRLFSNFNIISSCAHCRTSAWLSVKDDFGLDYFLD